MKKIIFIFLLSIAMVVSAESLELFPDIPKTALYRTAVFKLHSLGIILPDPKGNFRPDEKLSRAEAAVMLNNLHTSILNPAGLGPWTEFSNGSFTIAHPKGTEVVAFNGGVGVRGKDADDFFWGLLFFDKKTTKKENLISEMGKQFGEKRRERRENFILNGQKALHVIVTTTSLPNWKHEQIFIEKNSTIYVLSNGAIPNSDFELFYNSFKLILPSKNSGTTSPPK